MCVYMSDRRLSQARLHIMGLIEKKITVAVMVTVLAMKVLQVHFTVACF